MASRAIVTTSPASSARLHRAGQRQALLIHGAVHHGDGGGARVVVVEAGVVTGHPAHHVDLHLLVAVKEGVSALLGLVTHEVTPGVRVGGVGEERVAQLGDGQGAHAGTQV